MSNPKVRLAARTTPKKRFFCNDCDCKFRSRYLANRNTRSTQHYCSVYGKVVTRKVGMKSQKCQSAHSGACLVERQGATDPNEESEDETKAAQRVQSVKNKNSSSMPRKQKSKINNNNNNNNNFKNNNKQNDFDPTHNMNANSMQGLNKIDDNDQFSQYLYNEKLNKKRFPSQRDDDSESDEWTGPQAKRRRKTKSKSQLLAQSLNNNNNGQPMRMHSKFPRYESADPALHAPVPIAPPIDADWADDEWNQMESDNDNNDTNNNNNMNNNDNNTTFPSYYANNERATINKPSNIIPPVLPPCSDPYDDDSDNDSNDSDEEEDNDINNINNTNDNDNSSSNLEEKEKVPDAVQPVNILPSCDENNNNLKSNGIGNIQRIKERMKPKGLVRPRNSFIPTNDGSNNDNDNNNNNNNYDNTGIHVRFASVYQECVALMQSGNHRKVIFNIENALNDDTLNKTFKSHPMFIEAHLILAHAYQREENLEDALGTLEKLDILHSREYQVPDTLKFRILQTQTLLYKEVQQWDKYKEYEKYVPKD